MLQIGVAILLITSFEGFVIPRFASPILGRSAHSLMAILAPLFIALGLLWPRLRLRPVALSAAFWLLVYSATAIVASFLMGAVWGAGHSTMPLAGAPQGNAIQESVIAAVAYSSAPTGIISFALILWGLRGPIVSP
ncbi:MAG TPA: hypothetical protein VGR69_07440 [Candidatus Rubrimentiphilum sp.]|nr:hypothetical protein [Candidatus Rubrimentiphilum sp.]